MVTNPGIFLGREQVRRRRAEELHRRVVERWRVRNVDDHRGPARTSGSPSPVNVFTPVDGAAAMAS
jgi:hypothetical protein